MHHAEGTDLVPQLTARAMELQTEVMHGLVSELHVASLTWTNKFPTSQWPKVQGDKDSTAHASSRDIPPLLLL